MARDCLDLKNKCRTESHPFGLIVEVRRMHLPHDFPPTLNTLVWLLPLKSISIFFV